MPERKPPFVRCQCGRLHRTWNPHKVCNACTREGRSDKAREINEIVKAADAKRLAPPTKEELEWFERLTARWLARQSLDHPWRVARREEGGIS